MSYPINYPTPQGANVQIFQGGDPQTTGHLFEKTWVKPQGASFVWVTLIGSGGGGGGSYINNNDPDFLFYYAGGGGASGGVTNFMCPAFLLPDVLQVAVGVGGNGGVYSAGGTATDGVIGASTILYYQQKTGTGYEIAIAYGGGGGVAATAAGHGTGGVGTTTSVVRPMLAAGFNNATVGANGANGATTIARNGSTFVMGGNGTFDAVTITGYYGYETTRGYFQLSPAPLAIPRITTSNEPQVLGCGGNGGGSGGGFSNGGRGGDGLAIIVTW